MKGKRVHNLRRCILWMVPDSVGFLLSVNLRLSYTVFPRSGMQFGLVLGCRLRISQSLAPNFDLSYPLFHISLSLPWVSNCVDFVASRSPRRPLRAPLSLNRFRVTMNNNASTNSSSGSSHGRAGSCVSTTSPTPSSSSLARTPTTCTGWTRSRSGPSSRTRYGWTTYAKNSLRSQVNFTHMCVKTSSCNREF